MPLINGVYVDMERECNKVTTLRTFLHWAAKTDRLAHPAAVEWQRELVEREAKIKECAAVMPLSDWQKRLVNNALAGYDHVTQ